MVRPARKPRQRQGGPRRSENISSFSGPHKEGCFNSLYFTGGQWELERLSVGEPVEIPFPVYSLGSCSMKDHTVEGEHMYGLFFPVGREIYREQESFDLLYISVCGQPHGKAIQRYPSSHSRGGCPGFASSVFLICRSWEDREGPEPPHCLLHPELRACTSALS